MQNEKIKQTKRDLTIDIGKGIAIILMCVGHSYVCTYLDTFIYLFHMAFFFMMSGYFFREKNLENPKQFFWKRVKGLYFPFVKWGIAFAILHNVFTVIGINSEESGFYTLKEMAYRFLTTITRFIPTEECMGPYWFLSSLFYVSVFSFGVFYVNRKLKYKTYTTFATFLFFYFAGFLMLHYSGENGWRGTCVRTFVVSFLFYVGYLLGTRLINRIHYRNPFVITFSFAALCAGTLWGGKFQYPNVSLLIPCSF